MPMKRKNERHGASNDRQFFVYKAMLNRCSNPRNPGYKNYGGRGIKVCEEWMTSYGKFKEDMGERPSTSHTLERIDNDRDYCPQNCRWATRQEQSVNRRNNRHLEWDGRRMTIGEWARYLKLPYAKIYSRLDYLGWSVGEALGFERRSRKRQAVSA